MFALLHSFQYLAGGMRYGEWAPPGSLRRPEQGVKSPVDSNFSGCQQRACQVSGIFGPNGRLSGEEKDCWADGLCSSDVPSYPRVLMD
mmetsp:Transcript_48142/g.151055  ORF Transcript_48142/g.151055 Transcript_48142/m.151055 type:complete len:88 (+) Transcript_48142:247-510(+)